MKILITADSTLSFECRCHGQFETESLSKLEGGNEVARVLLFCGCDGALFCGCDGAEGVCVLLFCGCDGAEGVCVLLFCGCDGAEGVCGVLCGFDGAEGVRVLLLCAFGSRVSRCDFNE